MFFHRRSKSTGSFLLEALIAVSIVSVSLVIMIRSHLAALQAQILAKDYVLATVLLESEMMQLIEKGVIDPGINMTKKLPAPYERFTFSLATAEAGREYVFEGLNEAQLTLSWQQGQKQRKLSVSTFIPSSVQGLDETK